MSSLAWALLVAFGRTLEPLTQDEVAIAARSFGRLAHVAEGVADQLWRNLTQLERQELKAYARKRRGKTAEQLAEELQCS